jgi:hypothetical protein
MPDRGFRLRRALAVASAVTLASVVPVVASHPTTDAAQRSGTTSMAVTSPIDDGAGVTARASRLATAADVVSINRLGPMLAADIVRLELLAVRLGVPSSLGRSFNIGMTTLRRGGSAIQTASGPGGRWQFPMAVTALPVEAVGVVMSHRVAAALAAGRVVLGRTSADLRGAAVGDVLDLVGRTGSLVPFELGAIVPDDEIGGAELVMSTVAADRLGVSTVNRVVLFGQFDREGLIGALGSNGFVDGAGVRITRSWGPPNPDALLGSSRLKVLLGEFDYRVNSDDSLSIDAAWVAASLPAERLLFDSIAVRARCHHRIRADLQAAFDEVVAQGLASAIDLVSTNTYGGCYNPRYARLSQSVGSISRHAWVMAIDMNTTTNGQGSVPRMDCRVVRIFREHGFAWGGNFLVPDGMHFEWVGEPRHALAYPSAYCPNEPGVGAADARVPRPAPDARRSMFADADLPG